MKKNLSTILTIATFIACSAGVNAAPNYSYQQEAQTPSYSQQYYAQPQTRTSYGSKTLKGRVVTVPAGTSVAAVVTMPLSSANLTMGQSVSIALGSDFYYNNNLIAPAGSTVSGTVVDVAKAKHGSMNGRLQVRFTQIITPYGGQIPISAVIKTSDGTGLLKGGTKTDVAKAYAKDMGVGAGAGALTGLVASAISGGSVGKGTAIMTGVGAGAGLLKSGWDKGNDVEIPVNSKVELQLTQPITVNPSSTSYDY